MSIVVAASSAAVVGRADGELPVRVAVSGTAACADADSFYASIRARTARVRRALDGEVGRTVQVDISSRGSIWVGVVYVGGAAPRTIEAATCADVVSALSFATALALDPDALASTNASSLPSVSSTPSSSARDARVAPSTSASAIFASTHSMPPPVVALRAEDASDDARRPGNDDTRETFSSERTAWRLDVAAGLDVVNAGTLGGLAAPRVEIGFASRADAFFSPSFRVQAVPAMLAHVSASAGQADFRWTTMSLDGCPLRFAIGDALSIRPCVGLDLGALYGAGAAVSAPSSATRPWGAVRALLRAELRLGALAFVGADAGFEAPFVRDRFSFDDATVSVYRAPWAMPFFGLAAGVRFP